MNLEFWQLFLSADLPLEKSREFLKNLGTFHDPVAALRSWPYLSMEERRKLDKVDNTVIKRAADAGVTVLTERDFPDTLTQCPSPPVALFAWGDTGILRAPKVAIVGTRRATTYGKAASQKFAEHLSRSGVTVVSGGALGIDAAAHKGALEGGGQTVVVCGTGVDKSYPSTHTELYAQIRRNGGCLLSQFPLGTPSLPHHFLQRNQIIAAICDALLVIEAPLRSGSLSTASAAADLGKPVYVVPGNIVLENYRGSHQLIREGATLVDHPDQVLEAMGFEQNIQSEQTDLTRLTEAQLQIVGLLNDLPQSPETLLSSLNMSASELLTELTMLEIEGLVKKDGPGYSRK